MAGLDLVEKLLSLLLRLARIRAPGVMEHGELAVDRQCFIADLPAERCSLPRIGHGLVSDLARPEALKRRRGDQGSDHP